MRIPAVQVDFLIDAVDQRLFVRKVPVEQRLRDPEPLGEHARLSAEAHLAEERDGAARDQPLALVGGEALGGSLGLRRRHSLLI